VISFAGTLPSGLYVEDTGGPGRPVVLLHGWPMHSGTWEGQVADLTTAGHRVLRYDRRGFGRSVDVAGPFDFTTLAADLENVLAEREVDDATLLGFSMSVGELARYVSRFGEGRVRSLVLASTTPPAPDDDLFADDGGGEPEEPDPSELADYFDRFATLFLSTSAGADVRRAVVAQCREAAPRAVLGCMRAFGTTDLWADLKTVTVPTLVLHGSADALVPPAAGGRRVHAAIPHSELVILDGAPHGCHLTHRAEFDRALTAFLR
jgi:non-heme chloroperoxidase